MMCSYFFALSIGAMVSSGFLLDTLFQLQMLWDGQKVMRHYCKSLLLLCAVVLLSASATPQVQPNQGTSSPSPRIPLSTNKTQGGEPNLYGFSIGMSKGDICEYVDKHPNYTLFTQLHGEIGCSEMEEDGADVGIDLGPSDTKSVHLDFMNEDGNYDTGVTQIWIKFSPKEFAAYRARSIKKFGPPIADRAVTLTNLAGARLNCRQTFWRSKTTEIELDEYDEVEVSHGILILSSHKIEEARRRKRAPKF